MVQGSYIWDFKFSDRYPRNVQCCQGFETTMLEIYPLPCLPSFPSPPLPSRLPLSPSSSLPFSDPVHPFPSLPLEVGTLRIQLRDQGERCELPQWGLGEAPAEIEFGAF